MTGPDASDAQPEPTADAQPTPDAQPEPAPTADAQPEPAPAPDPAAVRRAVVRRVPRYRRFVLAGVLLGLLVALVAWLTVELPRLDDEGGRVTTDRLLVLAGTTGLLGGLAGGALAVVVDRRGTRSDAGRAEGAGEGRPRS